MEAETDIASFWGGREAAAIAGFKEGGREGGGKRQAFSTGGDDSKKGRGEKRGAPKPSTFN